ncbi:MAG: Do family serine endopeptidase, partial [Deltaproteobacteria bacterium]
MSTLSYRRARAVLLSGVTAAVLGASFLPAYAAGPVAAPMIAPVISFAGIVAQDKPAIVTVEVKIKAQEQAQMQLPPGMQGQLPFDEFFKQFQGQNGQGPQQGGPAPDGRALGSGFIIDASGLIVTNNHVIENASEIKVTLDDGREFAAELVGHDSRTDIAVLKIKATGLPVVTWGDSDALALGDPIIAIGNPFGIGTTVTSGIVSARGRDLHNGPYDDFIQVDAAINHGNSGGPLIDMNGNVVGITSAIFSPNDGNVGVGFVIPSDLAKDVVAELVSKGSVERGYLGINIQNVGADIAEAMGLKDAAGALVSQVSAESPAAKAGLQIGDVVTAVNGTVIKDAKALSKTIAALDPDVVVKVSVLRGGAVQDVSVTLGALPSDEQVAAVVPETPVAPDMVPGLGLEFTALTP